MNHYSYLLEFSNGMRYYGARSTELDPQLDASYLGSGKALPEDRYTTNRPVKTVTNTFNTRKELLEHEKEFLILNRCCTDAGWYNRRLTSTDRHGISNPWNQHKVNNKEKFSRTYSERYKGNRSPAMLAAHARTAELIRGVLNPAKGHKGITNAAFKPWYYITPKGEYVEVLDTTIKDMGNKLGLTTRQISNRFSSVNINKPAKTKPLKGWVFGYLPRPQTALD